MSVLFSIIFVFNFCKKLFINYHLSISECCFFVCKCPLNSVNVRAFSIIFVSQFLQKTIYKLSFFSICMLFFFVRKCPLNSVNVRLFFGVAIAHNASQLGRSFAHLRPTRMAKPSVSIQARMRLR